MCFSAAASFSVAGATALIGVSAVRHARDAREMALAVVPLFFAVQQATEGMIWLQLTGAGNPGDIAALVLVFRGFAEVLWPAFTAIAVLLIEPDQRRRFALRIVAGIGIVVSIYLLAALLEEPAVATIRNHSIDYGNRTSALSWRLIPYILCTCLPLLLSSHRAIQLFGCVVASGYLISAVVYFTTFVSVWCFFAAAGSTLIYLHFRTAAAGATTAAR